MIVPDFLSSGKDTNYALIGKFAQIVRANIFNKNSDIAYNYYYLGEGRKLSEYSSGTGKLSPFAKHFERREGN